MVTIRTFGDIRLEESVIDVLFQQAMSDPRLLDDTENLAKVIIDSLVEEERRHYRSMPPLVDDITYLQGSVLAQRKHQGEAQSSPAIMRHVKRQSETLRDFYVLGYVLTELQGTPQDGLLAAAREIQKGINIYVMSCEGLKY